MTIEEIRKDIEEIKYYYTRQNDIDVACKTIGQNAIIEKVNKYNEAMKKAPAQLFDIYIGLIVQGNTREALAFDIGFSLDFVKSRKKEMLQYLKSVL